MFSYSQGFRVEGLTDGDENWKSVAPVDPNLKQIPSIYRQHFYGRPHKTYMSYYSPLGPISMSIKEEKDGYNVLIYTEKGFETLQVPLWSVKRNWYRLLLGMKPTSFHLITSIRPELIEFNLSRVSGKNIQDELLKVYEPEFSKVMKVGVLYCKEGQTEESEMLLNIGTTASPEYNEFLNWLGEKVELKDFPNYNGGLDTTFGNTGTHSIYTKYNDVEIMYHVSTMLPFFPSDLKQIERKKHLGNDRIMIVFSDGKQPYNPGCVKSKQTQIIIMIQPIKDNVVGMSTSSIAISTPMSPKVSSDNKDEINTPYEPESDNSTPIPSDSATTTTTTASKPGVTRYTISIANKTDVPNYGPSLPNPPIFNKDDNFRQFLYEKMIAGAESLRNSPVFVNKTQREKNVVFLDIINKYARKPPPQITV
ncbi:hypothetical protein CYY_002326 [Polysphondylium violaceum]|uniref:Rap-GAP domain-containing protein n=1 Tax=Polysphondylium violaceum TaxID=133409 RepID=A0A8J4Q0B3_9MYCE|nr:hypothetical protein CYY_002326 [Polysphondylium violaceum]